MDTEEYRKLWKDAICLCEMEPNKEEAISFVMQYYKPMGLLYYNDNRFCTMNERNLLLTFIGLVVYEKKFDLGLGSTTPTTFCYEELLKRADNGYLDKEFVSISKFFIISSIFSSDGYIFLSMERVITFPTSSNSTYTSTLAEYLSNIFISL